MMKQLLGCAAVSALLMGAAFAQTDMTTTTSRTTVNPAPVQDYSATKTQTTTFGGASTESKQVYRSGPDGTVAAKKETIVRPDGSSETVTQKKSTSEVPSTTSSYSTTTTVR
ncbi:MAG: hypothetical protein WDO24_28700 [Pseudomonadota bacterium]